MSEENLILVRYGWEFMCKACGSEFVADWSSNEPVACPSCRAFFETSWEKTESGQILGPWLSRRIHQHKV